ncbi:hypothetical protein MPSEU_000630600 [Mayamaea pseudoterrestris]|nr:hypothetical protein MPSEU_000630600 [Mayamaea pseudoterrestris]
MPKRFRQHGDERTKQSRSKPNLSEVPFITVDGHDFYADRFYLTTSVHDDNDSSDDQYSSSSTRQQLSASHNNDYDDSFKCTCGSRQAPPLLDRSKLVASLDLKAAIIATFSIDANIHSHASSKPTATSRWLPLEFPSLFGPDATVPTLILHGQRRGGGRERNCDVDHGKQGNEDDACGDESSCSHHDLFEDDFVAADESKLTRDKSSNDIADDDDDHDSLCTQPGINQEFEGNDDNEINPSRPESPHLLPDSVYLTQVLSSFVTPMTLASLRSMAAPLIDKNGCVSQAVIDRRLPGGAGVHHPKYMILFETSGSVLVLVSTANLTKPCAMDASWVQRFPPMDTNATIDATATSAAPLPPCTDFGLVLADFLQQQTLACRQNQLTPLGFLRRHLHWRGCSDLAGRFDYRNAQVHLVGTVPGVHVGRQRHSGPAASHNLLYGRQRVAQILHQLSTSAAFCWLPRCLLSVEDRLVVQPTSLGSDWNALNMAMLVRSYLHHDDDSRTSTEQAGKRRGTLMERLRILWPTHQWMQKVGAFELERSDPSEIAIRQVPQLTQQSSPLRTSLEQRKRKAIATKAEHVLTSTSNIVRTANEAYTFVASANIRTVSNVADEPFFDAEDRTRFGNFLFMSSKTFNSYEHAILSQMAMFEASYPPQRIKLLTPHIKSIARVFEGNEYTLRQSFNFIKSQELFSWFLLTSGSLSRGAQGRLENEEIPTDDTLKYANFELGVLFTSRLQGNKKTDRVYCWKPHECTCRRGLGVAAARAKTTRLIHLPVPYNLRPRMFQASRDETEFCETPFFHEITTGTATMGNMRLTPYGAKRVAKAVLADRN